MKHSSGLRFSIVLLLLLPTGAASAQGLRLPFDGRWFVMQAGNTPNVNHHMSSPAQAYGIDFAKTGGASQRELTRGSPTEVESYYCWGQAVLAPADGTVTAVVSDLPDNPIGTRDALHPSGNHVVIQLAENRFAFLGHLQRGSISAQPDEKLRRGQKVGRCGNSGNSDYPHVHLHLQNTPTLETGRGQNPIFGPMDVELTGKRFSSVTWPLIRGLFVSNP